MIPPNSAAAAYARAAYMQHFTQNGVLGQKPGAVDIAKLTGTD